GSTTEELSKKKVNNFLDRYNKEVALLLESMLVDLDFESALGEKMQQIAKDFGEIVLWSVDNSDYDMFIKKIGQLRGMINNYFLGGREINKNSIQ
ncbi:MAG: hypothetical protein HQK53_13675, partial [Oligoflexia bacterium]|nr:hypothetical protein [Oligoflexia bacterium]